MITLSHSLSNRKHKRSGVIPYTIVNNNGVKKLYFLMGVDSKTGELTDFGGGVKSHESSLEGGVREFREESRGIFEDKYYDLNTFSMTMCLQPLGNSPLFNGNQKSFVGDMTIMFLPVSSLGWVELKNLKQTFLNTQGSKELSDIRWLSQDEFFDLDNNGMWKKVSKFLSHFIFNPKFVNTLIN